MSHRQLLVSSMALQVAQEVSERAAQGQHALDVRQAQIGQRDSDLKDLQHALQTQHFDLQHKHQQLQVTFLLSNAMAYCCLSVLCA